MAGLDILICQDVEKFRDYAWAVAAMTFIIVAMVVLGTKTSQKNGLIGI